MLYTQSAEFWISYRDLEFFNMVDSAEYAMKVINKINKNIAVA